MLTLTEGGYEMLRAAVNHALAEAALLQAVVEVKRKFGMTTAEICGALSVSR